MNFGNHSGLVLIVLIYLLSYASAQFRIFKGEPSTIENSPYVVSIRHNGKHNCVGSLVTLQLVVTAASCLRNKRMHLLKVIAGITDVHEAGESRDVFRTNAASEFDELTKDMDIGSIVLKKPFTKGPTIDTINICSTDLKPKTPMQIYGWGVPSAKTKIGENIIQKAVVPIVSTEICSDRYKERHQIITESMICAAGLGGSNACAGDGGAPGVVEEKLCAVVSAGVDGESSTYPTIYTNLNNAAVRDWIVKWMKCKY